jgi:aldehyde dehydrogenase (NAD+)
LQVAKAAQDAGVPPGVLNVVVEGGEAGAVTMSADPRVDMVAFTGSSHVGQKVMAQCAPTMKRLQLELGGKSAQIYLPDRAKQAVQAVAQSCTMHAGQVCTLGTRVFVPQEMKAGILEAMRERVEQIIVGDPSDPATEMGPVMSAAQRGRCERYVALATAAGARVVAGGRRPAHMSRGYYYEPTILDLPDNANPAAQDEIFGPVIGVIGYRSAEDVVRMANDTCFGLSGSVIGGDLRAAVAIARRIKTGTVNVNGSLMSAYVSSGGWKNSGVGRERGPDGLRIYQNVQILNVTP